METSNYYHEVTIPRRAEHLMQLAAVGAPPDAMRVKDRPWAYFVGNICSTSATVYMFRWSSSGKCFCNSVVAHGDSDEYNWQFMYRGELLRLYTPSMSVLLLTEEAPSMDDWPSLRKRATHVFTALSVKTERQSGDMSEIARRYYHRKQAARLTENLPAGYAMLPGAGHVAYKIIVESNGALNVSIAVPTTKQDGDPVRFTTHPLYGSMIYKDVHYMLAPDGERLYRKGMVEDLYGAGDDIKEQALVFEELRPRDKAVVPDKLAWYEIAPGNPPSVVFTRYKGRDPVVRRSYIRNSRVLFEGDIFEVDAFGRLKLVL